MKTLDSVAARERESVEMRCLNGVVPDKRSADPGPITPGRSLALVVTSSPKTIPWGYGSPRPVRNCALGGDDSEYVVHGSASLANRPVN
jgi:hypothetical protein